MIVRPGSQIPLCALSGNDLNFNRFILVSHKKVTQVLGMFCRKCSTWNILAYSFVKNPNKLFF